jgi:hypothetical protein
VTPKQLQELETWLAAGFDLPTALAAVQGDDGEDDEGDDHPPPEPDSLPSPPTVWHYLFAFAVVLFLLFLILR